MLKKISLPAMFAVSLLALGCEKKSDTVTVEVPRVDVAPPAATETAESKKLGLAINEYVSKPTAENAADVKSAFADIDGEIAELESRVAKTGGSDKAEAQAKLSNLQSYRTKESARYTAAMAIAPVSEATTPVDTRTGAEKVGSTLRKAGDKIENTAEKVGDSVKDATDN